MHGVMSRLATRPMAPRSLAVRAAAHPPWRLVRANVHMPPGHHLLRPCCRVLSTAPKYPAKGGIFGKLSWLVHEYGPVGIATHFSVYFVTLGGLFLGIDSGVLVAGDALTLLKYVGADRIVDLECLNPKASNFAVAWILAKFTEPMRLPVTLWLTPRIARLIRARGYR
mmetsp:Transcript_12924/g.33665  ORF Transcript_12924/g.33665 Transcript_12924/m.33665 type:complete len:168 (+) Transcript_12924:99-602(+)